MEEPSPSGEGLDPNRSVIDSVEERTGKAPRVRLSGSEGAGDASTDGDGELLPKGRGTYRVLGELARGGMGIVFRGHDTELGRDVALKVLDAELAKRPAVLQRFVEEAQIGGQLQHPGVVPVYELGLMGDERPFFTMKLIKGRTLGELLAERPSPDTDRVGFLKIFESVCQTVAYAHSKGVIHRDLKPANVMVGAFGEVQVVDWGLAKVLGREEAGSTSDDPSSLTVIETVRSSSEASRSMAGSIMGTPAYMPPEQASGEVEKLDQRTDVFALGAILCEILTGTPPYVGDDRREIVREAANARLDDAKHRLRDCGADDALIDLCLQCLMPARDARPEHGGELAGAIHEYVVSTENRARDATIKAAEERRRRKLAVALAVTVVVAVGAVGGGWYRVERARAECIAETQQLYAVEYEKALELQEAGRFEEAFEVAQAATRLVEAGEADEDLRRRSQGFVASSRERVDEQRVELELRARADAFVAGFERMQVREAQHFGSLLTGAELDAEYATLFRDYGLDMDAEDLSEALDTMNASAIAETFAFALDNWALVKRRQDDDDAWPAERLQHVATDLDPHPLRRELRRAVLAEDGEALTRLAEEHLEELPPDTIWVLGAALFDLGERERTLGIRRRAAEIYPDDFLSNMLAAQAHHTLASSALAEPYARTAHGLRPDNSYMIGLLGFVQDSNGKLPDAVKSLRRALELEPQWEEAYRQCGGALMTLGDYRAVKELVAQASGHVSNEFVYRLVDLAAGFLLGEVDADTLVAGIEGFEDPMSVSMVGHALIRHPDPQARHAERVLQMLERVSTSPSRDPNLFALVHLALGNGEPVLTACDELEGSFERVDRVNQLFFRAMAHHLLGRDGLAREWYGYACTELDRMTLDREEAWQRSDPVRYRKEAAELLGL